jgi:hypothetical protein
MTTKEATKQRCYATRFQATVWQTRSCRNEYTRNNRVTVGNGVFYSVGSNTSTVALRVKGSDEKGTQCLGL